MGIRGNKADWPTCLTRAAWNPRRWRRNKPINRHTSHRRGSWWFLTNCNNWRIDRRSSRWSQTQSTWWNCRGWCTWKGYRNPRSPFGRPSRSPSISHWQYPRRSQYRQKDWRVLFGSWRRNVHWFSSTRWSPWIRDCTRNHLRWCSWNSSRSV